MHSNSQVDLTSISGKTVMAVERPHGDEFVILFTDGTFLMVSMEQHTSEDDTELDDFPSLTEEIEQQSVVIDYSEHIARAVLGDRYDKVVADVEEGRRQREERFRQQERNLYLQLKKQFEGEV